MPMKNIYKKIELRFDMYLLSIAEISWVVLFIVNGSTMQPLCSCSGPSTGGKCRGMSPILLS